MYVFDGSVLANITEDMDNFGLSTFFCSVFDLLNDIRLGGEALSCDYEHSLCAQLFQHATKTTQGPNAVFDFLLCGCQQAVSTSSFLWHNATHSMT